MKKTGYTLAEVVIVMLIIAAVVGITIGLTKKKLDNVISYLYYSSYSIAQEAVNKMIENFKDDDIEYILTPGETHPDDVNHNNCDWEHGCLKVPAGYDYGFVKQVGNYRIKYGINMSHNYFKDTVYGLLNEQICNSYGFDPELVPCGNIQDAGPAIYKYEWDDESSDNPMIVNSLKLLKKYVENGEYNENDKVLIWIEPGKCSQVSGSSKAKKWVNCQFTGDDKDIFKDRMNNNDVYLFPYVKEITKKEWPNPTTIPRMGKNFCQKFVSYVNTSQTNAEECIGDLVESNDETGYYADKKPDIILRNGMKIYNMSQDPVEFDEVLSGNSNGENREYYTGNPPTNSNTDTVNIDEWGYLIYIDIDGSSGSSTLWQDVYPFYITMSGKVIPAYNEDTLEGGADKKYLMFGVFQEIGGGSADRLWIAKSAPFKDAACKSGYLKDATPYCSTAPAVTKKETCNTDDCKIEVITPLKFFK